MSGRMRREHPDVARVLQPLDEEVRGSVGVDAELGTDLQILPEGLGECKGLYGPLTSLVKDGLEAAASLIHLVPESCDKSAVYYRVSWLWN